MTVKNSSNFIYSEGSCLLDPNVRYVTCKNSDGSKFNGGKIKTLRDFKKFAEGLPNDVFCGKVECQYKIQSSVMDKLEKKFLSDSYNNDLFIKQKLSGFIHYKTGKRRK